MKAKRKQSGVTLTELTIVVAAISMLSVLSVPALKTFSNTMGAPGTLKATISAALASARAISAKEQRYAGIRFQEDQQGNQYMIFIVHDHQNTDLASGFRAVEGVKLIKLPENLGVMDLQIVTRTPSGNQVNIEERSVSAYGEEELAIERNLTDVTTFSIVFSPSGKLITHEVRIRNRHKISDTQGQIGYNSSDDVFNKKQQVDDGNAMFYQDDYFGAPSLVYTEDLGIGPEMSRRSFVIYDKADLANALKSMVQNRYLEQLASEMIHINPYTGTIISME